jgi:acid phosphatase
MYDNAPNTDIGRDSADTPKDWPYCGVAKRMVQMASSSKDLSAWNGFEWRRKMESFGNNDKATIARGPGAEAESMW